MPLQLVTPPAIEPISRTQAKNHVRLTTTDEDTWIDAAVMAARQACETRAQNQLVAARWKLLLDSFPGSADGEAVSYVPWGKTFGLPSNAIILSKAPVLQIASITYLDMAGATQTLTAGQANDYVSDVGNEPVLSAGIVRITPPFGKVWPANVMPQIGSVQVTFDLGYAAALTADASADTVYVPGWRTQAVNDKVRFTNRDGGLPAPLAERTDYFVQSVVGPDKYKLSLTSGGAAIDLTTVGTGDSFIGEIPANLRAWMLLAIGSLYENRESVSVDQRITQIEIPEEFQNGLLDPHRVLLY